MSTRQTINITRVPFQMSWPELQEAIADYLVKTKVISKYEAKCLSSKESNLKIQQETEGSPAYSVSRWIARGNIVIDNDGVSAAADAELHDENRRLREENESLREQISALVNDAIFDGVACSDGPTLTVVK